MQPWEKSEVVQTAEQKGFQDGSKYTSTKRVRHTFNTVASGDNSTISSMDEDGNDNGGTDGDLQSVSNDDGYVRLVFEFALPDNGELV